MKKKIILISAIIFLSVFTIGAVALACRAGMDYVTILVIAEQKDHYDKMYEPVHLLDQEVQNMQDELAILQKSKLTDDQKKDLAERLRYLEELGLQIDRRLIYYNEDNTAHMFFPPAGEIVSYFNEAHNTPIYVNRCVRAVEQGLFAQYVTSSQKKIIGEDCQFLVGEMERLKLIRQ